MTDSSDWRQTVVLEGGLVRLEPLEPRHEVDLWQAAQDPEIWRWLPELAPRTQGDMKRIVTAALVERDRGSRLPFAVVDREEACAIGTSRYLDIEPNHRRVEIGWTWFGRRWWGTGCNEESKLLLFRHAFETLKAQRVSLKTEPRTDVHSAPSNASGASTRGSCESII
jgi:RimJ/RimL family protein N-acetyltransferase